jgi:hypothetical protein
VNADFSQPLGTKVIFSRWFAILILVVCAGTWLGGCGSGLIMTDRGVLRCPSLHVTKEGNFCGGELCREATETCGSHGCTCLPPRPAIDPD